MQVFKKINSFVQWPFNKKALFFEALFTSAWVKITLKFFPFKKVLAWLGTVNKESELTANAETLLFRKQVNNILQLCNKYALWPTECYTLSLTGKLILKRRKIASTLYIGFLKEESGKYKGHAWLRANDTYISGLNEAKGFTVHTLFC